MMSCVNSPEEKINKTIEQFMASKYPDKEYVGLSTGVEDAISPFDYDIGFRRLAEALASYCKSYQKTEIEIRKDQRLGYDKYADSYDFEKRKIYNDLYLGHLRVLDNYSDKISETIIELQPYMSRPKFKQGYRAWHVFTLDGTNRTCIFIISPDFKTVVDYWSAERDDSIRKVMSAWNDSDSDTRPTVSSLVLIEW